LGSFYWPLGGCGELPWAHGGGYFGPTKYQVSSFFGTPIIRWIFVIFHWIFQAKIHPLDHWISGGDACLHLADARAL